MHPLDDRASTFCVSNQLYEASLPPPQVHILSIDYVFN